MFRKLLATFGIIAVLVPRAFIDAAERVALESPTECERKSWVVPAARVEGVVYLVLAWRGDTAYSVFKRLVGAIGLLALVAPRSLVASATELAYADGDNCAWKAWVAPFGRLVGLLFVISALDELRGD